MADYDAFPGHTLRGVPQEALDAARLALADACQHSAPQSNMVVFDKGDADSTADSVVAAFLETSMRALGIVEMPDASAGVGLMLPDPIERRHDPLGPTTPLFEGVAEHQPQWDSQECPQCEEGQCSGHDDVLSCSDCDAEWPCSAIRVGISLGAVHHSYGLTLTQGAENASAGSLPGGNEPPNALDQLLAHIADRTNELTGEYLRPTATPREDSDGA